MKNVLAISSSTKKAFIALKTEEYTDYVELDANCKQSENILFQIDALLSKHNLSIQDINNLAVVVGPGSFTGVRIGVALAKGLCAGNKNLKVYPISSFDVMAELVEDDEFVCVINALSGLYFVKEFGKEKGEEKLINQEEYDKIKKCRYGLCEEGIGDRNIEITSNALLSVAEGAIANQRYVKPEELSPVYLRNSQAEENLNKNKKTS